MRVLVAFDKFKDSLTAQAACAAAERALTARHPDWSVDACPLADGGDGFVEIMTRAAGGKLQTFEVTGPRGDWVRAPIGLVPFHRIPAPARALLQLPEIAVADESSVLAVIEMAAASGLSMLPPALRDPWQATSYGTGQLIRFAAEAGAQAVVLGIGGSATHDVGLGALAALGFEFRAAGKNLRLPIPADWTEALRIEGSLMPRIPPIRLACDVSNPLLGRRGAAAVYGPQKGLLAADLDRMEAATARVAALLCAATGAPASLADQPGAGAAGGIAFGLTAGAHAKLLPGFELVSRWLDLERRMAAADVVVTGEGRYDLSSSEGKGPGAVVARARALGRPVHVFAGQVEGASADRQLQLHAITPPGMPLARALREAAANLAAAVKRAF